MSDLMLFGVLQMPFDMAMENDLSRRQFYDRAQQAVDELARLRAEVEQLSAEQTNILQSACEATDEVNRLRKMNEGMRQQYTTDSMTLRNLRSARDMQRQRAETAERDRDELQRRIAEAPKADVSRHAHLGPLALADTECPELYGKRVALVRLDAEEGK